MEKTYLERLNEIAQAAQQAIIGKIEDWKNIVLFSATNDEDEWTEDIYDKIPDFPFYDKYDSVHYAAIKEVHQRDHVIEITGILKGDSYPEQIRVPLTSLDATVSQHWQIISCRKQQKYHPAGN